MKDNSILHNFVKLLKENGFTVYTSDPDDNYSYCHFVKDNKIGYVQTDYFGGLSFSTVHKGNREIGTGFGLNDMDDRVFEPTVEHAKNAFIFAPNWATRSQRESVIKYKNWAEYTEQPVNRILQKREL